MGTGDIPIRLKRQERETLPYVLVACTGTNLSFTLAWKMSVWTSAKQVFFVK
jgi:hypothetical protein